MKRSVSANRKPTTSRYNIEEGTQTFSFTTGTSDFWIDIEVLSGLTMSGVVLIIGIYAIRKKGYKRCKG